MIHQAHLMTALVLLVAVGARAQAPDLVLEDFEHEDYGRWSTTGTAFGTGPARGTLPNQMPVSGFAGQRLVNSFHEGDGTTGTLTSPEFTVEREHVAFLIGGGGLEGKTCVNLLVDGKAVRTATGTKEGSEELRPASWNIG